VSGSWCSSTPALGFAAENSWLFAGKTSASRPTGKRHAFDLAQRRLGHEDGRFEEAGSASSVRREELKKWRAASLYCSHEDFFSPSVQKNGTQPFQPDMILRRHIRPALEQMGVATRIGWHSFRHGSERCPAQMKVDVKLPKGYSAKQSSHHA
jgi:hypothetical protein